jgi:hypothetical protein
MSSSQADVFVRDTPRGRRKFSGNEDEIIRAMVAKYGCDAWSLIAQQLLNRTPRQCRERWKHYLQPGLDAGQWQPEEDALLRAQFAVFGPRWSAIRDILPNRTDVAIKNRWALLTRKPRSRSRKKHAAPKKTPTPTPAVPEKNNSVTEQGDLIPDIFAEIAERDWDPDAFPFNKA